MRWILRMAWRDSRSSRKRLGFFSLAIIFGVAALVSIRSFGYNLEEAVEEESKTLLGADLTLTSRQPFSPEIERFLESLGEARAREVSFSSMLYVPSTEGTRLVQVRGLEGDFPFYGEMETTPAGARARLAEGNFALVEDSAMVQLDLEVGDEVRVGRQIFTVAGALRKVPGEMAAVGLLAPRVYIPFGALEETGLLQQGSLARYKVYLRYPPGTDIEAVVEELRPKLREFRLSAETVERRKADLGRTMENIQAFFQLVGFVALLLGAIGVASAVHVYVKRKIGTAAVLRCLGASARQAFAIYLVQAMALGIFGAAVGAILGVVLQTAFPVLLREFLPFEVPVSVSWAAVGEGFAVGFATCAGFALLPLLTIRRVAPLLAIRRGMNFERERRRDPLRWAVGATIAAGVAGFAIWQTGSVRFGLGVSGGIAVAFVALVLGAAALIYLAKRFFPKHWPYVWRQGFANLYRPENRTVLLMLALGLGTFLVFTLFLTREMLLEQVVVAGDGDNPTLALFDIQDDQREPVRGILEEMGLPVLQDVPIVTMRLTAVKGRTVSQIMADPETEVPGWILRREYRSTYRDHTVSTETVVAGKWVERVEEDSAAAVPVSVEEGIATDLGVKVGDSMVFDVMGVPVETVVGSIRKVDWQRVQPNFFVVFPAGILEYAPKFHVLVTRTETEEESAALQREIVRDFPNISAIDLSLILDTLDSIMSKVAFVIRFLAMFTVLTGLVVLASAVASSRYQRVQEAVLLRTLGASRGQVMRIMLLEYLFLGTLAGTSGTVLALAGAWALAVFVFKIPFAPAIATAAVSVLGTAAVTVAVGAVSSRGLLDHPPLEVLREEG